MTQEPQPDPQPAAQEAQASSPVPPPAPPPEPPPVPPGRPQVEEVVAVPLSSREPNAPTIDVPPSRPPPRPEAAQQAAASAAPPGASHAGSAPPPPRSTAGHAAAERPRSQTWSIVSHLLLLLVIPSLFLGGVLTFLVWQIFGKEDAAVEDQSREALNFQINVAVLSALLAISCVGVFVVPVLWIAAIALSIVAAVAASRGEAYRYPLIYRLVKH